MKDSVVSPSGSTQRRNLGKIAHIFLPDEVVVNILRWLPAKDVVRYRCVCKLWRDLTSSKDFIDLHIPSATPPMIFKDDQRGIVLLDRCWEPTQTRSMIRNINGPDNGRLVLSHNGFLVVDEWCSSTTGSQSNFAIYNPIYRDVVKITVLTRAFFFKGRVCSVFFHPVQKEYCILWEKVFSLVPSKVQYRILNLESEPKWRDIATLKDRIWLEGSVLIIDKHLYWIVEPRHVDKYSFNCEITEYDIVKEEFRVVPCPVRIKIRNVNLVSIDGVVSVVEVLHIKESVEMNIWSLNDGGGGDKLWTSCNYVGTCDVYVEDSITAYPQVIAFRNGEMLLLLDERLYAWNLKFGTFRKYGEIYHCCTFSPHVMSLRSLKNCKSNICISDDDESNQP